MSSDYVRMTLKEALANFIASDPQQMNAADDDLIGPDGPLDRYEATIPAQLGGEDTHIIMDVTNHAMELSVHDECGDMMQSWTLTLERKE